MKLETGGPSPAVHSFGRQPTWRAAVVGFRWLPIAIAVGGLAATLLLWRSVLKVERQQVARLGEAHAEGIARDLRRVVLQYARSLTGIAERHGGALREDRGWRIDMSGLDATLWVERSGKAAWVTPVEGNEGLVRIDFSAEEASRRAMVQAGETGQPVLSASVPAAEGDWHSYLVVPVSVAGQRQGFLVGVFRARSLYPLLLPAERAPGWAVAITEHGRESYRRDSPADGRWLAEATVEVLGSERRVLAGPIPEERGRLRGRMPAVVFAAGSLIAVLFALSAGLAQSAWRRAREAEAAESALRGSEQQYRLLFESNPQPMWVYDPADLRFLAVNAAAVTHYGYSREEFLGMTIADIRPTEDLGALRDSVQHASDTVQRSGVWRHRKKDGTLIEVEIFSHPVRFAGRQGRLVLARDVTETRRLEEQLRHSQKLDAIGRLAGGVAHDFNNLLGVITGYGELLERETAPEDPRRRRIEQIRKAAGRAANLTRQLLAFSRRQVLQPQSLDLNAVVADMEKMLQRLIGEDLDLVTVLGDPLGRIKCDPGQIEQILMNLAVNARDAMPQGGRLTIQTANVDLDAIYAASRPGVEAGSYVMLAVSDTGHGMTPEVLAHVFEPFFTTKEPTKGTGLGLATVHGIVKQSGGHIFVYSEVGRGTTFKIYLPRLEGVTPAEKTVPVETALPRGSETVLLVEDEASLRSIVRECLEGAGYTVLEARHPGDALETIARTGDSIELLMTDVIMPGMSGRELAERLASSGRAVRVLYMSGYTDDAVVRHGVLSEEMAFLQKPFTIVSLLRKVREVLDQPPSPARP